jgi:hypothetical protein
MGLTESASAGLLGPISLDLPGRDFGSEPPPLRAPGCGVCSSRLSAAAASRSPSLFDRGGLLQRSAGEDRQCASAWSPGAWGRRRRSWRAPIRFCDRLHWLTARNALAAPGSSWRARPILSGSRSRRSSPRPSPRRIRCHRNNRSAVAPATAAVPRIRRDPARSGRSPAGSTWQRARSALFQAARALHSM